MSTKHRAAIPLAGPTPHYTLAQKDAMIWQSIRDDHAQREALSLSPECVHRLAAERLHWPAAALEGSRPEVLAEIARLRAL